METPGTNGTISSRPWMVIDDDVKKKSKAKPLIINHIFYECSKLIIDDEYWSNIFIKASYGKFQKGFSYKNSRIIYRVKTKVVSEEVPNDAYRALDVIYNFMRKTASISSSMDKTRDQDRIAGYMANSKSLADMKWSEISNKMKLILLYNFIEDVSYVFKFNENEKREFERLLNIGFSLSYLDREDIVFNGGRIEEIYGIYRTSNGSFCFTKDRKAKIKKTTKTKKEESKNIFREQWKKFLHRFLPVDVDNDTTDKSNWTKVSITSS